MKMYEWKKSLNDESGAVTVDWVVLTATMVVMGVATTLAVNTRLNDIAGEMSTHLTDTSIS